MKFILVSEPSSDVFAKIVQKHLDEGYELRGETFVTSHPSYRSIETRYNQILIKNE